MSVGEIVKKHVSLDQTRDMRSTARCSANHLLRRSRMFIDQQLSPEKRTSGAQCFREQTSAPPLHSAPLERESSGIFDL